MKAIRVGSKGALVRRWQQYLRGLGYDLVADGDFGPITRRVTIAFQASRSLVADGIAGNQTFGAAMSEGFSVVEPVSDGKSSPGWPPPPTRLRRLTRAERREHYGHFSYEAAPVAGNREAIKITKREIHFRLVNVELPQLVGVLGFPSSGRIIAHAAAERPLQLLVEGWEKAGLLPLVESWGGCWAPRFIRGSRATLSNHSWGTAFDINVAWNGLGKRPALVGARGSVRELVPLANECGFFWGGHFARRPDGMHFELGGKSA